MASAVSFFSVIYTLNKYPDSYKGCDYMILGLCILYITVSRGLDCTYINFGVFIRDRPREFRFRLVLWIQLHVQTMEVCVSNISQHSPGQTCGRPQDLIDVGVNRLNSTLVFYIHISFSLSLRNRRHLGYGGR